MKLQTKEAAFRYVINKLEDQGYRINHVQEYNKTRHRLYYTKKGLFYVVFKREFFLTFSKQFPVFAEQNPTGYGESINKYFLEIALAKDAVLLFVYSDGKIYKCYPKTIKTICEKNNLIRIQEKMNAYKLMDYSGKKEYQQEITYSFPLFLLERFLE